MIEVLGLGFSHTRNKGLFRDFDLSIGHGESWAVVGRSGCGKSTLLALLAGLLRPESGEISIAGEHLLRPRPRTGLVLQDHGLLPWATVRENVRLGLTVRSFYGAGDKHVPEGAEVNRREIEARTLRWMQRLGVDCFAGAYPSQLSRGQRQRTAIARSMAVNPDVLLLDEPFSALDAPTSEDLHRLVLSLHSEREITVVLVTHDIDEALRMGEKILVLRPGVNSEARIVDNAGFTNAALRGEIKEGLRSMIAEGE
jgi:NitT/TauT family transport system ATP-binding protein